MKIPACILIHFYSFLLSFSSGGNIIQVIDTEPARSAEVRRIVEFYLHHFEIENQKVVIFMSPRIPDGYKAYLVAAFRDKHGVLGFTQVNVDNKLKGFDLAKVIGHEIYHIKQMADNRLVFLGNSLTVKWKGKIFSNPGRIPYERRPWERECLMQELSFAKAFFRYKNDSMVERYFQEQKKNKMVSTEKALFRVLPDKKP